ncbi:MAG: hypothetical protein K9G39_05515 [Chlorobium sp.]|uniref:hypothetical protein n=1 Tax=Chlorobium sp. TaxID=1095 RepID=UPI0025C14D38|nr:hypothetical protein [Chlorobium sp.]MCF8383040.1 hypothetical protein [Chlorobium sp.]
MKMTKAVVAAGLAVMLGTGSAVAGENPMTGKFGLGYQGVFAGDILQGISGRYWATENFGGELNLYYGRAGFEAEIGGTEVADGHGDLLLGTLKLMYSPIVKENSRFYVGLEGGIGSINAESDDVDIIDGDITVYTINPFFGAEYNFTELPELGLNFEVGYKFHNVSYEDEPLDVDVNLDGTFVSLGAHYYF